ncbi:hypothetical protein [Allohahella marinimesophila]|uniref:DUF2214 domain-containing protein n=1 Tax=Allohahella marinimesophila TaxID=1054972 RepID=A0ABP7NX77_9GAMM
MSILAWLEASGPARILAQSEWLYPLVNAGHIVGIALLVGTVAALDMRILGWLGRSIAIADVERLLRPLALIGLGLVIVTGLSLFSVQATSYAESTVFRIKLLLIAVAGLNAALYQTTTHRLWHQIMAALSLLLWLAVITMGRLIGFR